MPNLFIADNTVVRDRQILFIACMLMTCIFDVLVVELCENRFNIFHSHSIAHVYQRVLCILLLILFLECRIVYINIW